VRTREDRLAEKRKNKLLRKESLQGERSANLGKTKFRTKKKEVKKKKKS